MALVNADRLDVGAQYMRAALCPGTISKAELAAGLAAIDDWLDTNQASLVAALPTAFKNATNASQKYQALMYVLEKRMGSR